MLSWTSLSSRSFINLCGKEGGSGSDSSAIVWSWQWITRLWVDNYLNNEQQCSVSDIRCDSFQSDEASTKHRLCTPVLQIVQEHTTSNSRHMYEALQPSWSLSNLSPSLFHSHSMIYNRIATQNQYQEICLHAALRGAIEANQEQQRF
jgi:hypothetical protein